MTPTAPTSTDTSDAEELERGMVVSYHGSIAEDHVFEFVVLSADEPGGRFRLGCREFPWYVLRQVRRASVTPTGETVSLCRCDHEYSWAGFLRDDPHRCGASRCTCTVHTPNSVAQLTKD